MYSYMSNKFSANTKTALSWTVLMKIFYILCLTHYGTMLISGIRKTFKGIFLQFVTMLDTHPKLLFYKSKMRTGSGPEFDPRIHI